MATNTKKKAHAVWTKAKWKGFVNATINQQEKKQIKGNLLDEVTGYEFLMNAATAGYKLSISYSIPEDVFTVSMTGMYREKPNAGITMSQRHRDLIVAMSALAWCLSESDFDGDWGERFGLAGSDDW